MVRQDDRGVDLKPTLSFRTLNGIAQGSDLLEQKPRSAVGKGGGEATEAP
jgi:hypothetical protein